MPKGAPQDVLVITKWMVHVDGRGHAGSCTTTSVARTRISSRLPLP